MSLIITNGLGRSGGDTNYYTIGDVTIDDDIEVAVDTDTISIEIADDAIDYTLTPVESDGVDLSTDSHNDIHIS